MSALEKIAAKFAGRVRDRGAAQPRISLRLGLILFALAGVMPGRGYGQLELMPGKGSQGVFAGGARTIHVAFHNTGKQEFANAICTRLYLASTSTAVLISETPWKSLQVPAGAIVLESAELTFPVVRAETKFLVQWLENSNRIIGVTEVRAYPTNLLTALQPLAGGKAIGILDPQNELRPLLKGLKIGFENLGNLKLEDFSGKLAIVGPFQSELQIHPDFGKEIKSLAKKGVAVVWIQPPGNISEIKPSFYCVPETCAAIVIVQPNMVSDLAENPVSQLNLIHFCKLALNPRPPALPSFAAQL